MKDLLTAALATAWVLVIIQVMRTRRHPRERPDHIDRDWRGLVARVADAQGLETYSNGR